MAQLEICVDTPAGAAVAAAGGADRIELCAALSTGGLTPTPALLDAVLAAAGGASVHAMVRPRAGDFTYDGDELATALAEARDLAARGAYGLVFGAVADGRVDVAACRAFVDAARGAGVTALTFHRAVDTLADPVAAVDAICALGFDHVLTSGGAAHAADGLSTIAAMVARAGDRVAVMAGSGITPANAAAILHATGVAALHASASRAAPDPGSALSRLGFAAPRPTEATTVRALRAALDGAA